MEQLDDLEILKLKSIIISNISIVDLMHEYGIKLESKCAGNFNYRTFCPFHRGKNNRTERTPSMFVSEKTNSFYCFSCGSGTTVIDFVRLTDGTPSIIAIKKLAKKLGIIDKDGKWDELKIDALGGMPEIITPKTIDPILFEISSLLNSYIKLFVNTDSFEEELKWMEKVSHKVDNLLLNITYEELQKVYENIQLSIKNRMRKRK